jgi:hypothetical protein
MTEWHPASGLIRRNRLTGHNETAWRVYRTLPNHQGAEEARGLNGRRRLFRSFEAADKAARKLNESLKRYINEQLGMQG